MRGLIFGAALVLIYGCLIPLAGAQEGSSNPRWETGVSATQDGGTATLVSVGSGGEGTGGSSRCTSEVIPDSEVASLLPVPPLGTPDGSIQWVVVRCRQDPSEPWVITNLYQVGDTPPVALLLEEARRQLVLPLATADMAPDPQFGVANAEAFLWIDSAVWIDHSATASLPGASLTLTASPVLMTWDMGEGSDRKGNPRLVRCASPGVPFDIDRPAAQQSTDCSYRYNTTSGSQPNSEFLVRPYIEWTRTWVCEPGCGSGSLPNLVMEGNTLPARIGEIQALGTNGGVG